MISRTATCACQTHQEFKALLHGQQLVAWALISCRPCRMCAMSASCRAAICPCGPLTITSLLVLFPMLLPATTPLSEQQQVCSIHQKDCFLDMQVMAAAVCEAHGLRSGPVLKHQLSCTYGRPPDGC